MLDRSMLRRPKCMCCIPVETGCFIFGVFSSVLSGFGVIILSIAQLWISSTFRRGGYDRPALRYDYEDSDSEVLLANVGQVSDILAAYAGVLILYLVFLTSFIFSVFLCYGTHKKRPGFVKAYLVYGVVMTVLMMIGAILYSWAREDIVGGSLVLIVCGIYSMMLLMVQRTHERIRAEQAREQAQLLPNIDLCVKA